MRVRTSGQENFVCKTSYEINWKGNFFFGYGCTGVNLTKLSLGIVADFRMLKFRTLNDDKQKSIWTISRYFRQTDFFLIFSFLWQARWWQGLLYRVIHHYEYVTDITECPTDHWLTNFASFNDPRMADQSPVRYVYCDFISNLKIFKLYSS